MMSERAVFAIIFLLLVFTPALACTCINARNLFAKEHNKYLDHVAAIFEGEVVSLGEPRSIGRELIGGHKVLETLQPVRFRVFRTWKGPEQSEITVETDAWSSCRLIPSIGDRAVVYAGTTGKAGSPLQINYCSIGKFDDRKMKVRYGPGRIVEQPAPLQSAETPGILSVFWAKIVSLFG